MKKIGLVIFENSLVYRWAGTLSRSLDKKVQESIFIGMLFKEWNGDETWKNSWVYKVTMLPVKALEGLTGAVRRALGKSLGESCILAWIKNFYKEAHGFGTREIGWLLLMLAVTETGLAIVLLHNQWRFLIIRGALILLAGVLIYINQTFKGLWEGSVFLRIITSFFKNQERLL